MSHNGHTLSLADVADRRARVVAGRVRRAAAHAALAAVRRACVVEPLEARRLLANAPIIVSTLTDELDADRGPTDLSLREALDMAAQTAGDDVIKFVPNLQGVIHLSGALGELKILTPTFAGRRDGLTIQGPGTDRLAIDAGGFSRVISIEAGGALSHVAVQISGLTIEGGAASSGAGLWADGIGLDLALNQVVIASNVASGDGGGIYTNGEVTQTLTECTVKDNQGRNGAGIFGTLITLVRTTISTNSATGSGGGVSANELRVTAVNSTFSGNTAADSGGAISLQIGAHATLTNVTISQNHADDNYDGSGTGGGIHSTLAGSITTNNCIVANNFIGIPYINNDIDVGGVAGGYNLIGTNVGNGLVNGQNGNQVGTAASPLDPGLDSLQDNGGPTRTMAPREDSIAIDAGNNDAASGLDTDQRGRDRRFTRGVVDTGTVDVGAYEAAGTTLLVTTLQDEVSQNGTMSLREALALSAYGDEIDFAPGVVGTMKLSPALKELRVGKGVIVHGPGSDKLTISGQNVTRVMLVPFNTSATLSDLTIANGHVAGGSSGAGVYVDAEAILTLNRVVIKDNIATGGVGGGVYVNFDTSSLKMFDCAVVNNTADRGGGIFSSGLIKLTRTTVSGNHASDGAGIWTVGIAAWNSTISGNIATRNGGGIYLSLRTGALTNCTVVDNRADFDADGQGRGGGIYADDAVTTWKNVIVADNALWDDSPDDYDSTLSTLNRITNSIIGSSVGNDLVNGENGNQVGTAAPLDPNLMPLGYYGGLTQTQPPRSGSPAIDKGDNVAASDAGLTDDQRGIPRAIGFGATASATVDIGAAEAGGAIVVNTLLDENVQNATTSLREAIALAQTLDGNHVVQFDPSLTGVITLAPSLGELTLGTVTIQGPGADQLSISGGNRVRVFSATAGGAVTISGLRITGGLADLGAALRVQDASVTLDHVVLEQNLASDQGGALYAAGTSRVTLVDCFVDNNVAARGGGIASRGPATSTATLTLIRTTLSGNQANPATQAATGELGSGGGVLVAGAGLLVVNSTFSGNSAKNDGGGLALYAGAAADLTNATIAQNHADNDGDAAGKGAGVYGGSVLLLNSIIAGNVAGNGNLISDVDSAILAPQSSYNLIGSYPGSALNGLNGNRFGTPAQPLDVRLLPLADYGGTAPTHALRGDSPAIDAGSNAAAQAAGATVDQRGQARILSFGGSSPSTVDIGAYEAAPPIVVTTLADDQNSDAFLSLREALSQAEIQPGWDVVRFDPALLPTATSAGTLTLALGSLRLARGLEIHGPIAAKLTISGGDARQIFRVDAGVQAVITDLTLAHGLAQGATPDGGAVWVGGDLQLRHVLLSNNHATHNGGAIYSDGTLTMADVTVAQNRADQDGGGVYLSGTATRLDVTNATIAENRADADGIGGGSDGGVRVPAGAIPPSSDFLLYNTIVAANRRGASASAPPDDVSGQFTPASAFNFIGAGDGSQGLTNGPGTTAGTAAAPADPRLESLGDYGGNTLTYAIKPGSPVIDAGGDQAAVDAGLTDDQRHLPRFRDGDGNGTPKVDVGAFEQQDRLNIPPRLGSINVLKGATENVNARFEISYEYLRAAADVSDPDGDSVSFRIISVLAGALQRADGTSLPAGTIIGPGDRVFWVPPSGISFGNDPSKVITAFSVSAWDGKAASDQVSNVSIEVSRIGRPVNYAVLFSGGIDPDNNQSYYYDNVRRMYQTLINDYGLDPDNIYVIYAGGRGTPDRPGGVTSDLTFGMGARAPTHLLAATRANLSSTLADLGGRVDDNDHFLFWAFDHGLGARTDSTRKGEETLQGWGPGETIGVADLRAWLQGQGGQGGIRRGYSTYLLAECYAGGMLDALDVSDTDTWHAFGAASSNHYEESIEQAFASPFTQALHSITGMTGPAFQYALAHDTARASDAAINGGTWQLGKEHPWSKGPDFAIFAAPQTNAQLPTVTRVYPLKFDPAATQLDITYDMLMAATDAADPSGPSVVFRLDPFLGQLFRDGVAVTQATVGYGQRVTWRPQTITPGATVTALALRLLDANGVPIGAISANSVPVRFGSPTPGPIARDDSYRVKNTVTRAPVPVAANDSGASLAVVDVGQALHGTVELLDGAVLYTPDQDFLGRDTFSYVVVSGGVTDMATVQVDVVNFDPGPQSKYLFTTTPLAPPPGWAGLPSTGTGWDWATYRQQLPSWTDSTAIDINEAGGVVVGVTRPLTNITDPGSAADQAWLGGTTAAYLWQADTGAPYWRTSADGTVAASNTLMLLLKTSLQHAGANDGLTRTIYDGVGSSHFTGTSLLPTIRYLDPDNGQEGRPLNAWGGIWFDVGDDGSWRGVPDDQVFREMFPVDVSSTPTNAAGSRWAAINRDSALATKAQLWTIDPTARTLQFVRELTLPGGARSAAADVDAVGKVVGWSEIAAGPRHAFYFDGTDVRDLGTLPGFAQSRATAVNDAGAVVGLSADDVTADQGGRAFIWSGGQIRSLGALGATGWSVARDVNAQGMVVGSSNDSAFLWVNGTMYNLNESLASALPDGVTLIDASAINDAGQIAATARVRVTDPVTHAVTVHTRAYLLELDPSLLAGQVVGRHLVYGPASGGGAGGTIAADKQALMPGQAPSAANSTGYSSGINGVVVDIARPPGAAAPTLADFEFRVGTAGDPGQWQAAPATSAFSLETGAGDGGADRVTIRWADGTIRNQWLQVRVKASGATGITQDDVFYFGNLPGDTNGDRLVNFSDLLALAKNYNKTGGATLAQGDFDGNGAVNFGDLLTLAKNYNQSLPPIGTAQVPAATAPLEVQSVAVAFGLPATTRADSTPTIPATDASTTTNTTTTAAMPHPKLAPPQKVTPRNGTTPAAKPVPVPKSTPEPLPVPTPVTPPKVMKPAPKPAAPAKGTKAAAAPTSGNAAPVVKSAASTMVAKPATVPAATPPVFGVKRIASKRPSEILA